MQVNEDWLIWLTKVMQTRPKDNFYLDSDRGLEIGTLCINLNRDFFSWRKNDVDSFWIDVQLYTKYKLNDEQITFIEKMQAGIDQNKINAEEKNAYNALMRSIGKLKELNRGVEKCK